MAARRLPAVRRRCHAAGIGVIQDVVYNHPAVRNSPCSVPTSSRGPTPGATSSTSTVRGRRMRHYILDNVRMWLEDYHVDGLRLDAVHALNDASHQHLLEEMSVGWRRCQRPCADRSR